MAHFLEVRQARHRVCVCLCVRRTTPLRQVPLGLKVETLLVGVLADHLPNFQANATHSPRVRMVTRAETSPSRRKQKTRKEIHPRIQRSKRQVLSFVTLVNPRHYPCYLRTELLEWLNCGLDIFAPPLRRPCERILMNHRPWHDHTDGYLWAVISTWEYGH